MLSRSPGENAIRWPLKSLRRYGAEDDVFSIEAGRKCPTGPGIYAFRCRRASSLLKVLQDTINANAARSQTEETIPTVGIATAAPPMIPRHQSIDSLQPNVVTSATSELPMAPASHTRHSSLPTTDNSVTSPVVIGSQHLQQQQQPQAATSARPCLNFETLREYENVDCNGAVPAVPLVTSSAGYLVPNTPLSLNFPSPGSTAMGAAVCDREYENVGPSTPNSILSPPQEPLPAGMLPPKPPHVREFFQEDCSAAQEVLTLPMQLLPPKEETPPEPEEELEAMNYISVEFDNSAAPPASPGVGVANGLMSNGVIQLRPVEKQEYVTIDIDRTKALSNTAKQQSERINPLAEHHHGGVGSSGVGEGSPGGTKKRHNSTLSELNLSLGNFSLSGKRNSLINGD